MLWVMGTGFSGAQTAVSQSRLGSRIKQCLLPLTNIARGLIPVTCCCFVARYQSAGPNHDPKLGWGHLLGDGLEICEMPGDHRRYVP